MFVSDLLQGKRILVTGGGTGLGLSFAKRFAELGAEPIICGRRAAVLDAAAAEIGKAGGRVSTYTCDIRDSAQVEAMFEAVWAEGALDGLVNNAAGNFIARTDRLSPRAVDAVFNVVLHGTAYCTIAAGRRWIDAGRPGVVLSIVSSAAENGRAFTVPSAAAKAGVLAMMKSLAVEWGPHGIRTAAIAPGMFPTPGAWERLYPAGSQPEPQENQVPLKRLGEHSEIANLCAYMMSDQAGYLNGECITLDGGWALQQGGGAGIRHLFNWTDADWAAFRSR